MAPRLSHSVRHPSETMWGEFETVYAVTDYVDGILAGVADFQGSPQIFVLEDENVPLYRLTPINSATAAVIRSKSLADIWNPTPAIEELVRTTLSSTAGGFLVPGEFTPVQVSLFPKPDLHVRWDYAVHGGV